jgi:hypothetical protein
VPSSAMPHPAQLPSSRCREGGCHLRRWPREAHRRPLSFLSVVFRMVRVWKPDYGLRTSP